MATTIVLIAIFTIVEGSNYNTLGKSSKKKEEAIANKRNDNGGGKFALLTHQELAYLSDGLPQLTNAQKSKLNYKMKKKIEIFEKVGVTADDKGGIRTWVGFTICRE